jgi:thermostable 8-oxoguanine DNA glycosylase
MQRVYGTFGDDIRTLDLPDPDDDVLPGVPWGRFDLPLTPASWVVAAWQESVDEPESFRLGDSLAEEVAACILGSHGIPAEVGLAAFARIRTLMRDRGYRPLSEEAILEHLVRPLDVHGRPVRYRFPNVKSRQLAEALRRLPEVDPPSLDDRGLRSALMAFPGIGPKTASWIVRNQRASDSVAILDIHIVRACLLMGVFTISAVSPRNYMGLEDRFLEMCREMNVRASVMDAVMWKIMRSIKGTLLSHLVDDRRSLSDRFPSSPGGWRDVRERRWS